MILNHIVCSIIYKYLYYNYSNIFIYFFNRKLRIDYDNIFYLKLNDK